MTTLDKLLKKKQLIQNCIDEIEKYELGYEYSLKRMLDKINEDIKQESCPHLNTYQEDFEDHHTGNISVQTICKDCGKIVKWE